MSDRSTENGKTFSDPVENPSAFQVTIINFFSNFKQHTFNIFLKPYIVWHIDPTANMSLNHTTDGDSMSIQYAQTTTHQRRTDLYPMSSSSRLMNSKKKWLRVNLPFFSKKWLTGRTSERNSCCGWRIEWSLGTWSNGWSSSVCDEPQLSLSVDICFSCFISFACWCNVYWSFRLYFFRSFSLMTSS